MTALPPRHGFCRGNHETDYSAAGIVRVPSRPYARGSRIFSFRHPPPQAGAGAQKKGWHLPLALYGLE